VRDAVVQQRGEDLELADEDGDGGFVEGRHFWLLFDVSELGPGE
jgi:hypothetical protein